MSIPRRMKEPRIDHDALGKEIEAQIKGAHGAEIHTRAQVRLDTAEKRAKQLTEQQQSVRNELRRTDENLARLQRLRDQLAANEADITIELGSELEAINYLRQSGISL